MQDSSTPARQQLARQFAALDDDAPDGELTAACLVAQALDPQLDPVSLRQRITTLCQQCDDAQAPWLYLRKLGFQGGRTQLQSANASSLDVALSVQSGLPITLGVLLIALARSQGQDSWGVNFPGHFLVRVGAALIDPYEMALVNERDALDRLPSEQQPDAFARATPRLVALRMLNNLKYQFANAARWDQALEMLDFQLMLAPDDPPLLFERGGFWLRLGAVDIAREALEACLQAAAPDSELARLTTQQLSAIAGQHNTLH